MTSYKYKQFNGLLEMNGLFRIGFMLDEKNSHLTTCYFSVEGMESKTSLTDMLDPRFHTMIKNTLRHVFGGEKDEYQNKGVVMVFKGDEFSYHVTETLHSGLCDELEPLMVNEEQAEYIRTVCLMLLHEHLTFLSYRINQGFTLGHIIDEHEKAYNELTKE